MYGHGNDDDDDDDDVDADGDDDVMETYLPREAAHCFWKAATQPVFESTALTFRKLYIIMCLRESTGIIHIQFNNIMNILNLWTSLLLTVLLSLLVL